MSRRHPADLIKSIDGDMFTVPRRTAPPPQKRVSGVYTHMAWAGGGFVLGAICWHMVGFWSFVDRMLEEASPQARNVVIARPAAPPGTTGTPTVRLISAVASGDCVRQVVVEALGESDIRPCIRPVMSLPGEPDAVVAGLAAQ